MSLILNIESGARLLLSNKAIKHICVLRVRGLGKLESSPHSEIMATAEVDHVKYIKNISLPKIDINFQRHIIIYKLGNHIGNSPSTHYAKKSIG